MEQYISSLKNQYKNELKSKTHIVLDKGYTLTFFNIIEFF